jgi:hypothetical protein
VFDGIAAVPSFGPENEITGLGLIPWKMLAIRGYVLFGGCARDLGANGLANGILGETRAVEATIRRATAAATAIHIRESFFGFCVVDNIFTLAAARRWRWGGASGNTALDVRRTGARASNEAPS